MKVTGGSICVLSRTHNGLATPSEKRTGSRFLLSPLNLPHQVKANVKANVINVVLQLGPAVTRAKSEKTSLSRSLGVACRVAVCTIYQY